MTVDGRRARGDRARAGILPHAVQIASRDGLEHLTIGRVAADAGVSKGNIQVLFGDKEALQLATIDSGVAIYVRMVVEPALEHASPLARLTALIEGWYDFVAARALPGGCLIHALSSEYRTRPGAIRDRVAAHRSSARQRLLGLVAAAGEAGEIGQDTDAEQLVFELLAYQAMANVAALMDDEDQFALARRTSRYRLDAIRR